MPMRSEISRLDSPCICLMTNASRVLGGNLSTAALKRRSSSLAIALRSGPGSLSATSTVSNSVAASIGTTRDLRTRSIRRLRARIGTYRRVVSLDKGEAYFQVKHDAGRPFVVAASGHRLTDLGTKFLVRSGPDRFEVAVFEGKVEFESQDGRLRQPLFLGAGDVATGAENTIYVAKKPRRDLTAKLGWQRGVLIFDHTTLADAAAEFNRYNREKILIADSDAAQRMIGGTFPADDVGAFTRLAHEVFGLHVENHGTETVISR